MSSYLVKNIYSQKTIEKLNKKNELLGLSYHYNFSILLTIQLVIIVFIFILSLVIKHNIFISLGLTILYYYLSFGVLFDLRLKKRAKTLEKEASFYFQILALTLKSGTNLKGAIELTSQNVDGLLSNEFRKLIDDVNLGKSLTEGLNDLKLRIPSDTVNNIILNLLESNIYGNNMIESLETQLDYLNDKLLLETKARINKMPIKISIVSVLIFIPLILIIILGPILLNFLNN